MPSRSLTFTSASFSLVSMAVIIVSILTVTILPIAALAQGPREKAASRTWVVPRTADGRPDFQGVWANNNATPLERPKELAGRATLTDAELAAMKKKAAELFDSGESDAAFGDQVFTSAFANVSGTKSGFSSTDGGTGDYSSVWLPARDWDNRTSLISDPADGRIPPVTAEAQSLRAAQAQNRGRLPSGPEDRSLSERCISFGTPRLTAAYNSMFEIVQSAGAVSFLMETIHDARVIPLDGTPHLPASIQNWLGDPRGHWEGDTLVVETTNYKPGAFMNISTAKLRVTERFTRVSQDILRWEVTVDDPGAWTKPWTAMVPLHRSDDKIYEYACHEGNIGLEGILAGARAEEQAK